MKVPRSQAIKVRQTAGQTPISWSLPVGGTPLKKNKAKPFVRSGQIFRSFTRLPISGRVACVASRGGSFGTLRWHSKPGRFC